LGWTCLILFSVWDRFQVTKIVETGSCIRPADDAFSFGFEKIRGLILSHNLPAFVSLIPQVFANNYRSGKDSTSPEKTDTKVFVFLADLAAWFISRRLRCGQGRNPA
jgi:hypothetical protein